MPSPSWCNGMDKISLAIEQLNAAFRQAGLSSPEIQLTGPDDEFRLYDYLRRRYAATELVMVQDRLRRGEITIMGVRVRPTYQVKHSLPKW